MKWTSTRSMSFVLPRAHPFNFFWTYCYQTMLRLKNERAGPTAISFLQVKNEVSIKLSIAKKDAANVPCAAGIAIYERLWKFSNLSTNLTITLPHSHIASLAHWHIVTLAHWHIASLPSLIKFPFKKIFLIFLGSKQFCGLSLQCYFIKYSPFLPLF